MKFKKFSFSAIGLAGVVLTAQSGITAALAQPSCEGGWVMVGDQCVLPDNLVVGDQIQITIGSAVNLRSQIIGFAECDGHRTYYTIPGQTDCGWREGVTAFSRTSPVVAQTGLYIPQ